MDSRKEAEVSESWASRVLRVRNQLGMSQPEFASRLGISVQSLVVWEQRTFRPYSRLAERFEEVEKRLRDSMINGSGWFSDDEWREIVGMSEGR